MSYVACGLGATVNVSTPTVGALVTDAIKAVAGDSTVKLSPQSDIILSTSKMAIEGVLGKDLQGLTSLAVSQVSSVVTDMASDIVGDVGGGIPLVGQILGWASFVVKDIIATYSQPSKAEQDAQHAARCSHLATWFRPLGTGMKGVVPADIFAEYIPIIKDIDAPGTPYVLAKDALAYCMAHSYCQRPLLGNALIAATEGNSKVSAGRKAQFKKLRTAMAAQFMRLASKDGGANLWPLYMDLIMTEADAGHMSAAQIKESAKTMSSEMFDCRDIATSLVLGTMDQWGRAVRPIYSDDVKALKAQSAKIKSDIQAMINKKLGKTTIASQLSPSIIATVATMMKPKTTTVAATKKPLSPVAAVGLGMALAGVGTWVLIARARARRRA